MSGQTFSQCQTWRSGGGSAAAEVKPLDRSLKDVSSLASLFPVRCRHREPEPLTTEHTLVIDPATPGGQVSVIPMVGLPETRSPTPPGPAVPADLHSAHLVYSSGGQVGGSRSAVRSPRSELKRQLLPRGLSPSGITIEMYSRDKEGWIFH